MEKYDFFSQKIKENASKACPLQHPKILGNNANLIPEVSGAKYAQPSRGGADVTKARAQDEMMIILDFNFESIECSLRLQTISQRSTDNSIRVKRDTMPDK